MKSTLYPEVIYENFDRGNYAEIRAELNYPDFLSVSHLQEITMKLNLIEKNENLQIQIINIDMIHKTMRVNILVRP
jgi:hypothetical protein